MAAEFHRQNGVGVRYTLTGRPILIRTTRNDEPAVEYCPCCRKEASE